MNNSNNKKNITLLVINAILFFVSISLFFFVRKEINNMNNTNVSLSEEIVSKKSKNLELDAVKNNLKETVNSKDKLFSLFVDEESVPEFIGRIEDLGRSLGLLVSTKSVDLKDDPEIHSFGKKSLVLNIEASGDWDSTFRFLELIEVLPFKVSVKSFNISVSQEKAKAIKEETVSNINSTWTSKFIINVVASQ